MPTTDKRVDQYIAKQPDFARPILEHVRGVVHASCPEVVETIKWGSPTFMYRGILGGMVAFKERCMFGFWKGKLITDKAGKPLGVGMSEGMSQLRALEDLPSRRVLTGYVRQAMKLNEDGVKTPKHRSTRPRYSEKAPAELADALKKNAKARAMWDGFSPSHRREYVEWISEAKTVETRERRVEQTMAWLKEGKPRNWKYMRQK